MDFYSDDSDPDIDEDLREDLDALRRSCILSGADPDAAVAQVSSACLAGPSTPALAAAGGNDGLSSDDDEDLALVRSIRENLHRLNRASPGDAAGGGDPSSSPRPICTWPPSDTDEDEDDLETLRAIQRRFSHYRSSTSTTSPKTMKPEASQGVHSELFADRNDDEFAAHKQNTKAPNRTGFPKAALLLVDALKKNRACQKLIRRKLINIEAKIEENKDLGDRVKCLLGYQLSCRRSASRTLSQKEDPRVRLISSRKPTRLSEKNNNRKMPALFLGPAENPHVSKYKMVLEQFPMSFKKQPWSDVEKDKLARGIKQQYQETLILDSLNNGSAIGDFSAVDMAYALTNAAGNFEVTPESLRSVLPLINWDKISAMYLPGRSGAECESRWLNCDDPLINREAWTAQEETKLLLIVQEKGMYNWINIAVTLGTYRTPFQCLVRYQRSLNPHIMNKAWTKEEDLQLQAAVETFGEKWQLVSASLDGRTGNQCSNRWRKTLHPTRTRVGRWHMDEDKRLMVSVKLIGSGSWSRIAPFIPGRTQTQCHERWCNILDPNIDLGKWRPEEDSKLLAAVSEFGPCWSKIAMMIPGRNDNMCSRRWNKLCKHQLPAVKAAIQLKKSVFQTNFVDRAKERPAIAPSDLIALVQSKDDGSGENTRDRSRKQTKENLAVSNIVTSSTAPDFVAPDTVSNTISRRPRRKSTGQKSKKQTEENVAVPDGLNGLSSGCSRSRKRKSTTGSNAAVQKRMRGSISVDNEAVPIELRGTDSANNAVGTNRIMDPVSVGEEGVVQKRTSPSKPARGNSAEQKIMTGSIPVGIEAVPIELRGTVSTNNEVGTNTMMDPVSVGDEGVVKKRTTRSKPAGSEGATRKRRCSISADNEAGTNMMRDPVSGEEGVVKKRMRRSKPVGNDGAARKTMRASVPVGDEGVVKKRTGSVTTENHGGVTKRKRAPSRRKSAGDNLTAEDVAKASPELGLPSTRSEERVVDAGNIDKGRRKSTPRPKQIDMSEGDADKHSPSTRLANCLSFARMKGTDRNRR
ncbi:hypothetical protein GQ55_2G022200 [Panicum hallii var. hallii]|uniref:Myb transcription factor n=1 Tax=Panicum hallii var. hallii TaxID=1504633 RepID=A0A2T7EKL4_9POAL|nr:hypothetical protein GQ55_2G022200 [Panicum hallii var. hallii]